MRKKKILALIPTRINSKRLPAKALLEIKNLPMIIHVYRRVLLSKKVNDVLICCDHKKVLNIAKKYGAKAILTSKSHVNGTERICEAFKKIKKKYDLVVDVQGDEPLFNPLHIDKVIDYHLSNMNTDIVLPNLKIKPVDNKNIVKIVSNKKNQVMYLSRENIPSDHKNKIKNMKKHLSIISFKPEALLRYGKSKRSELEKSEDIELLRALDIGLKINTISLKGDSFSVDVLKDYKKARVQINNDKFFRLYK